MAYTSKDIITLELPEETLFAMRAMLVYNFGVIEEYLSFNPDEQVIVFPELDLDGLRNLLLFLDTNKQDLTEEEWYRMASVADFLNFNSGNNIEFHEELINTFLVDWSKRFADITRKPINSTDELIRALWIASYLQESDEFGTFDEIQKIEAASIIKEYFYDHVLDPAEAIYYDGEFAKADDKFDFAAALAELMTLVNAEEELQ